MRPLRRHARPAGPPGRHDRLRTHPPLRADIAPLRKAPAFRNRLRRHLRRRRRDPSGDRSWRPLRVPARTRRTPFARAARLPGVGADADRPGGRPLRAPGHARRGQGADARPDQPHPRHEAALYSTAPARPYRTDTMSIYLGVNIDHIATLRQARKTRYPSPVEAALAAETAGADSITLHLREDRRHIQDQDVETLRAALQTRMNLEMAVTDEMVEIALRLKPQDVCLVPEKREERTTEGGLDVVAHFERVRQACNALGGAGIRVSLFIAPENAQL